MIEVEPITMYNFDPEKFETRAELVYPDSVLDEMARRVGDKLDEEILARLGYVKVVRCRECENMHRVRSWAGTDEDECWLHASPETGALGKVLTDPDGYCAWGKRKEEHE